MSRLIDNFKFNIGDKVKVDTSLMNADEIKKCKLDSILNLTGEVISENNILKDIWEHEVNFGHKTKILTSSFLKISED